MRESRKESKIQIRAFEIVQIRDYAFCGCGTKLRDVSDREPITWDPPSFAHLCDGCDSCFYLAHQYPKLKKHNKRLVNTSNVTAEKEVWLNHD